MRLPGSVLVMLLALNGARASADQPVIRISIDRVQLDAVVTDAAGQPVTDLGLEDFAILESGQPREVTNVTYVDSSTPGSAGHERAPRTIVVVFDDLGISLFGAAAAKAALERFAGVPFAPGDHVGLVRTSQKAASYTFFGTNEELLAAASKLRGHAANMSGADGMEDGIPALVRMTLDRRLRVIVGTIDGLRGLPGRKAVVLLSEGFPPDLGGFLGIRRRTPYDSLFYDASLYRDDYAQALQLITEVANRASAVIYAVDPRGVVGALAPGQDSLQDLADRTCGLAVLNRNDILRGLRQVIADQAGYYLLGFEPPGSTFHWKSGRPEFHSLKVKVNRPGLKVRSRSGFYGITDQDVARRVPQTALEN